MRLGVLYLHGNINHKVQMHSCLKGGRKRLISSLTCPTCSGLSFEHDIVQPCVKRVMSAPIQILCQLIVVSKFIYFSL